MYKHPLFVVRLYFYCVLYLFQKIEFMHCLKLYFELSFIVVFIFFTSCKEETAFIDKMTIPIKEAIDGNHYEILKLSDYADNIEYIPLETTAESLFPSYFDLIKENIYYNKGVFIFPFTKKVLKFDSKGTFLGGIGRFGEGPGEYTGVWSMDVDDNNRVYIMDGPFSVNLFTLNGNYLRKIALKRDSLHNHFQKKFQAVNDNLYVFDLAYWKIHEYMIAFSDSTSMLLSLIKDTQPEIKENGVGGLSDAIMYHSDGKVHYYKPIADTIYSVDASMFVKPEFVFDYGRYKYPLDQNKRVPGDVTPEYIGMTYLHESRQFLFMEFAFGALAPEPFEELRSFEGVTNTITNRYVKVLYNKSTGKVHLLKQPRKGDLGFLNDLENGGPAFWPTFVSRDETEMMMIYDADKFIENYSKVKNPSKKLKKVLQSLKFDSNPVVIVVKLK